MGLASATLIILELIVTVVTAGTMMIGNQIYITVRIRIRADIVQEWTYRVL